MNASFKLGVGRAVITPPVGEKLYGYPSVRLSESIHDDLACTCLLMESGSVRALLLSADLCTFSAASCDRLRALIREKTDIAPEHILFSCTHTHSGPATSASPGWGSTDDNYIRNVLEPKVLDAVQDACANLREAVVGMGVTRSDIGINRRQLSRDGKIELGQNSWGPCDPTMTVLSFRSPCGAALANLIHYGCHATAAGCNSEITRDWPGPMVDALEEQSGAPTVFFNGAQGDVGPRLPNGKTTGTLRLALDLGARAGMDAVRAWRSIKEYRSVRVRATDVEIALPWDPLPGLETAREEMARLGDPEKLTGMSLKKFARWQKVIAEHESGEPIQTHFRFQQSIVAVGPVAFVPFPYEIFAEIALRIQALSPFQHTLSLSNTNGAFGYFPTLDQFPRGGYEITSSRFFGTYTLAMDADNAAVDQSLKSLESLA